MKRRDFFFGRFFPSAFILFVAVLCVAVIQTKYALAGQPNKNKAGQIQNLTMADMPKLIYDYKKNVGKWVYVGEKPAIIDFYADWCGPCKEISPIIKRLAKKYRNEIVVYKVDVDVEKELTAMFGIRSIPTLVFLPMEGNPFQSVGKMSQTEQHLESLITDSLLHIKK